MSNTELYLERGLVVAPGTRFRVPVGNTGNRPSNPSNGEFRFNTDIGSYEGFITGQSWGAIAGAANTPANLTVTSFFTVGNASVNTFVNSSAIALPNVVINSSGFWLNGVNGVGNTIVIGNNTINTTGFGIGNSTVSMIGNSSALAIFNPGGNTVLNTTALMLGGVVINTTSYPGTAASANNAAFLGGQSAASYATLAGLAANVAHMTANNTALFQGLGIGSFWTTSSLQNVSQLNNNIGYAAQGSQPTFAICYASTYHYSYGNIYAQGDVYAGYSDIRLKCGLHSVYGALDMVDQLSAVYYWPTRESQDITGQTFERRLSLIAQDVQKVMPEAVSLAPFDIDPETGESKSGENYLTYSNEKLVPLLVEAIKELRAEIRQLKGY